MSVAAGIAMSVSELHAAWGSSAGGGVTSGSSLPPQAAKVAGVTARKEWGWITENPLRDLKKPRHPDHREVVIRWGQIKALLRALGWRSGPAAAPRRP